MDGLDCSAEEFNTSILDQHTLISSNAYPHKKTLFLRYAMSIHFHPWNRLQICLGLGGSTPSAQFPGQAAVGDTDHTTLTKFRHAVIVDSIFPTVKPASKATFLGIPFFCDDLQEVVLLNVGDRHPFAAFFRTATCWRRFPALLPDARNIRKEVKPSRTGVGCGAHAKNLGPCPGLAMGE